MEIELLSSLDKRDFKCWLSDFFFKFSSYCYLFMPKNISHILKIILCYSKNPILCKKFLSRLHNAQLNWKWLTTHSLNYVGKLQVHQVNKFIKLSVCALN